MQHILGLTYKILLKQQPPTEMFNNNGQNTNGSVLKHKSTTLGM